MGLEKRQTCTYLTVMKGKIVMRVPEGTEGARQRTTKSGDLVSEVFYDAVEGVLSRTNVFKHQEFGNQWTFDLVDGGDTYRLQLPEGRYLSTLLTSLPMADLEKPIKIIPYEFNSEDGKQRRGVSLRQNGEKLGHYFTKDDPKGLPELKQVEYQGKVQWDDWERYQFLEKFVAENIKPQLSGSTTAAPTETEKELSLGATNNDDPNDAPPF